MYKHTVERGDVLLVSLNDAQGAEKLGVRPAVVLQVAGALAIIVPLTCATHCRPWTTQVFIGADALGPGSKDSLADCAHVRSIDFTDSSRGIRKLGHLRGEVVDKISEALHLLL